MYRGKHCLQYINHVTFSITLSQFVCSLCTFSFQIWLPMFNLIKITYLTCFPLLICLGVGDLKKPHYSSHVSDLVSWIYYNVMINSLMTIFPPPIGLFIASVTFSYHHFHWLVNRVTHMWPVMVFPQISPTSTYQ